MSLTSGIALPAAADVGCSIGPRTASDGTEIVPLTSVRGLAAMWVVLFHYWGGGVTELLPELDGLYPFVRTGDSAVAFFFILSGLILGLIYRTAFQPLSFGTCIRFLTKRLARIYPLHLATLVGCLLMVVGSRAAHFEFKDSNYTLGSFVGNVFLVQSWSYRFSMSWNYPSWSISSEWFAYMVFPFAAVVLAAAGRTGAGLWACFVIAFGSSVAVYTAFREGVILPFYGLVIVLPLFLTGVVTAFLIRQYPHARVPVWLPDGLLGVGLVALFLTDRGVLGVILIVLFWGMVYSLAVLGNGASAVWTNRPVHFLGRISYSIYLTHTMTYKVFNKLIPFDAYHGAPMGMRLGIVAIHLALVLVISYAAYKLIERPGQRWLLRWTRTSPAPAGQAKDGENSPFRAIL